MFSKSVEDCFCFFKLNPLFNFLISINSLMIDKISSLFFSSLMFFLFLSFSFRILGILVSGIDKIDSYKIIKASVSFKFFFKEFVDISNFFNLSFLLFFYRNRSFKNDEIKTIEIVFNYLLIF